MKVVILAGGLGTRLSEETGSRPKPMVQIGDKPILWHIMKLYSAFGLNDFVVCCGYKGYIIKEYFANYFLHTSDVTFNLADNSVEVHHKRTEPWKVTLVDTGDKSMTGGRIKRIKDYVKDDEDFCLTYGDGVSNVDIGELIKFHKSHGKYATLTGVFPPGRFGALDVTGTKVNSFVEKPKGDGAIINGGFFVLKPKVIDYISDDSTTWEQEPMKNIALDGQMQVYKHSGFWQPMDTLRDKQYLEDLWQNDKAPWKLWS